MVKSDSEYDNEENNEDEEDDEAGAVDPPSVVQVSRTDTENVANTEAEVVSRGGEPAKKKSRMTSSVGEPRGRGRGLSNNPIFSHFTTLGKRDGGQRHNMVVCKYCQASYDMELKRQEHQRRRGSSTTSSFLETPDPEPPKLIRKAHDPCKAHLEKCTSYLSLSSTNLKTPPSSVASSQTTQAPKVDSSGGRGRGGKLTHYYPPRDMSTGEVARMNSCLVELIVDAALPFCLVERESFVAFVNAIRPGASNSLPSRFMVAGKLLSERAEEALEWIEAMKKNAAEDGHYAGLVVDTWMNVCKKHIEGVMLKYGLRTLPIDAQLQQSSDHHGIAIAKGWEALVKQLKDSVPLRYFVSDDAGQCGRARRILARRHPHILWLRCFAHQVNLMVKSLLKLPMFSEVFDQASASVNTMNASSSKWLVKFRNETEALYGKQNQQLGMNLIPQGETRWNSTQNMFASLGRVRGACKTFVAKHDTQSNRSTFPKACRVWGIPDWWNRLEEAELLIRPFCDASFLMQRECNMLPHVFLMFLDLYRHLQEYSPTIAFAQELQRDIINRWKREEHPLYFLALAMHPQFAPLARLILQKLMLSNIDQSVLSYTRLVQATLFYYQKHRLLSPESVDDEEKRAKELGRLKRHMMEYLLGRTETKTLSLSPWLPTDDDPVAWWHLGAKNNHYPELSRFGCFLLGCPVQSALCERLFKEFARQHTKSRNRLGHKKVFYQSVIIHDMQMQRHRQNTQQVKAKQSTNRFVSPNEHPRVDDAEPTDQVLAPTDVDQQQAWGRGSAEQEEVSDDDDDGSIVDIEGRREGEELSDFMVRVLGNMEEEGDDEDEAAPINIEDVADAPDDEDPFESVDESNLDDFPDNNVANFAQEDAHYFRRKNYVRNDKYELSWFFLKDVNIPKLMDLFKEEEEANS
jgi:Protein of unknown function (DUF 659)/hAT family C-terminal dimerisation region